MRLRLAVAVALALAGSAAHAAPAPEAYGESIIEITLNGERMPEPLVVRRGLDGTLLVRAEDLKSLRLKPPAHGALTVNGERYYRIDSEIGATVSFDDTTQSVDVNVPAQAFVPSTSVLASADTPRAAQAQSGGFVNYDVSAERVDGHASGGGYLEAGVFGSQGVLTASAVARTGEDLPGAARLDTTWTRDFPDRMTTLRVGDAVSSSGSWGRAARFAGVQYGTNFSTQPTFVTTPLLSATGDAVLPSTVEVFVNGNPVASQDVQPGPFQIEGVPAVNGAGQMQVVVTDALGRQQVIAQPYYAGNALLRAGLSEYSVEAGAIRQDYAVKSNDYGDVVGAATYRHGINDRLTAEVHAEGQSDGTAAGGAGAALQVGNLGIVSGTAAVGGSGDGLGWLTGLGFEHSGPVLSLYARMLYASESFSQLGSNTSGTRPRSRTFGGVGLNLGGYGSLQLAYGRQENWNGPGAQTLGLGYSLTLGALGSLNLFASHYDSADSGTDFLLTWTMPFGERGSASATLQQNSGGGGSQEGFSAVASVQQNLPVGSGSGYVATLSTNDDYHLGYAYQGHAGLVSADYARANGQDGTRIGAVGGVAISGLGVMPSQRLDQSFAMVKVADYAGMQVYLDNQPVGRTDAKGRVLLDNLLPYQTNQVSIDPRELPMDATISSPTMTVTPAYRSGVSVAFPVSRADSMTMRLLQADGQPVPAGATVMLEGKPFPVGLDGLVYVSGIATNAHAAVTWRDGKCAADFVRPSNGGPVPDLGDVPCR
ncbi:MAG TPA: fimbria/pilus outer membrane usher protein [Steroidobacteraceae bacterium]|nr:fimbria/pilus outer membrane usher protein [Steroidobacteraceae bacterium]HQR48341.1 fimbria/pilus outer membrane usher protein [Steroidobacteraceae bacterium]